MRTRVIFVGATLGLLTISAAPVHAMVLGEGVNAVICADSDPVPVPRRLALRQTITNQSLTGFAQVGLVLGVADGRENVDQGKVTAKLTQVKPDGSENVLGKISGKMRDGEIDKVKIVDGALELGDVLVWAVKLKKMMGLVVTNGEMTCLNVTLTAAVADELPLP